NGRSAAGHLKLARQARTRVRDHTGERDAALRGQVWNALPVRGRRLPRRLHAQRASGLCQGSHAHADRPFASRYGALARGQCQTSRAGTRHHQGTGIPRRRSICRRRGHARGLYRAILSVPMLKEDALVGVVNIYRQEVRPFSDKQVELVSNFAKQAVIAIENARLLNELRQRTDDLGEALEQKTATSEVLGVISSSPGELERVFETILANATRLCEAKFGILDLCEGEAFREVALHGVPPAYAEERRREPVIHPGLKTASSQGQGR